MRKLLNSLFVMSEDVYLALDNENIVMYREKEMIKRFPLLGLENIISFSYKGASPALMGECVKRKIGLCFFTPYGKFLARASGILQGNVLLRKEQYRISDDEEKSILVARNFIAGKLYNAHSVIRRMLRDHPLSIDCKMLEECSNELMKAVRMARKAKDLDELRGIEGNGAHIYFSCFGEFILTDKQLFNFAGRNKRPPTDPVNAVLSFLYVILAHDCASALEGTGMDSYTGFLHRGRPGRESLALDLMEEFRHSIADRATLFLINNRMLNKSHFDWREGGAVYLNDKGRRVVLTEWDRRKKEQIEHPFLGGKIQVGLLPHVQALLLARYIRGDIDEYPAYLWR